MTAGQRLNTKDRKALEEVSSGKFSKIISEGILFNGDLLYGKSSVREYLKYWTILRMILQGMMQVWLNS